MLYLVRKLNESIIINDDIEVKVVEIKGKSVKLGFEFPSTASILRKEVHDRVVAENLMAAAGGMEYVDGVDLEAFSNANKQLGQNRSKENLKGAVEEGIRKAGGEKEQTEENS